MNVGIVGLGPSAHVLAVDRPPLDEYWGMAWDPLWDIHGCSVTFDCHDHYYAGKYIREPEWTQNNYPIDEVIKCIGREYFESTFAYMLGLAILQDVDSITCWGIDLDVETEWAHQRPNAEWLVGIAEGRGIMVDVSGESSLMKSNGRYCWI